MSVVGEDVVSFPVAAQCSCGEEPVAELDAAAAGEVVIAGSGLNDRALRAALAQGLNRGGWGDPGDRLERGGDVGPGELVIAVAALHADAHQATVDEAPQVRGGGRRGDPGMAGKLAGRERASVGERGQHRRPSGMAEQRADRRQVPITFGLVSGHDASLPQRWFRLKQSVSGLGSGSLTPTPRSTAMADHPITTSPGVDPAIEHVFTAWDDALGAKDLDAAMALYHPDATLESPLVAHLLGVEEGIVRGRDALRSFVAQVFEHQPAERRRFRNGFLTDGQHLTWEYPRQSPDGDQMDIVEVMEITDGLIAHHRVYWGWKGVGMLIRDEHGR